MSDLGDLLRRARAHKGVTLRDAEKRTRINRNYLAALEAHDFDQLPPRAYARGIVRNYAQYLGLDAAAVLTMFEAATSATDDRYEEFEVVPAVQPIEIHGHWAPNFAIIIFMLVISAVIFTWIYSAYLQPEDTPVPTTIAQPTPTPVEQSLLDTIALTPTPDSAQASGTETGGDTTTDADAADATPTFDQDSGIETSTEELAEPETPEAVAPGPDVLPEGIQVPPGYHIFAVYAEGEVWVQVTLDGDAIALDSVLQPGQTEIFLAQTATVTSGNAGFVRVYVDGEDYGILGDEWDATVTYP